jgi:hypothetical protein
MDLYFYLTILFLELCSFKEIAMNAPLERKRRPGRPKTTKKALEKQPNETQNVNNLGICSCDESDLETQDDENSKKIRLDAVNNIPVKKKVGRPAGSKNKKK